MSFVTPLAVNIIGMLNLVEINATKDVAGRLGNDTDRLTINADYSGCC